MLRKHDARYAFKDRKRLGSGTSARVSLAWFLLAVRARRELTVTMDHDREIISLVFAPAPPIEGSCE
jgi:hypothetical protein